MRFRVVLSGAAVLLAGCVTTGDMTPRSAAPLAYKALGDKAGLYWVEAAQTGIARAIAQAALTPDMPAVQNLKAALAPAAQRPISIAVAGTDSAYTALVLRKALESTAGGLPQLQLVFIGNPAHEAEVRAAVLAKGGTFRFEAQAS